MSSYVNKVIKIAEAEVGYLEKKSASSLDSKTENAGSANYTKYSRDLVSWIGNPYAQGVAWCDQFVDWCLIKAFGINEAKKLLGDWSAYTPTSAQYYKKMGRWHTSSPQVGDQIFFRNSTRICHTGIVYYVDSSRVYTIEGNTSGASGVIENGGGVCKKSYSLSYAKIAGYGRPVYDEDVSKSTTQTSTVTKSEGVCNVTLNVLKKGSKGTQVKALQILLNGYGCNCGAVDGDFGTNTYNQVVAFQSKNNLEADGIVGTNTWNKLLGK